MCQSVHSTNTLPLGCICVRCIYIWPRGGRVEGERESGFGALAGASARTRLSLSLSFFACVCARAERGSVVPAVLLFGIARAELTQVSVW